MMTSRAIMAAIGVLGLIGAGGLSQPNARSTTQPARAGDGNVERLWKAMAGSSMAGVLRAVEEMEGLGDQAVAFLRGRLSPIPTRDAAAIQRLIGQLDSSDYRLRERAMEELSLIGIGVEVALHKALESAKSAESRARLEQIVKNAYSPAPIDSGAWRWLRAIRVLERIGSSEARAFLGELAKGAPEARATQQAEAALRRLGPAAKTDSFTWWLARAEEEAEIEDELNPSPNALPEISRQPSGAGGPPDQWRSSGFAEISRLLSDAGLTEAAAAVARRANEAVVGGIVRYHLAAAYARAGNYKAAHSVAAEDNSPDGRTEVNCRIGIALASIGWVEPNVAYTRPSADWIAATVAHAPDARQADKWKVPEGLMYSAQARIHAAIAVAHAAAGRKELYRRNIDTAESLIDRIPGDIDAMFRTRFSSDSSARAASGPDPMNGIYKTSAIEAVVLGRARAGDYDGARSALQRLPAGPSRDARARLLAEDLADRGELKEAQTTADTIQDNTHRSLALFAIIGTCLRTGDRAGAQALADRIPSNPGRAPPVFRPEALQARDEAYQAAARLAVGAGAGKDQEYQAAARYDLTIRWLARTQAQTPGRSRDDILRWIRALPRARSRFQAMLGAAEGIQVTQRRPAGAPATQPARARRGG